GRLPFLYGANSLGAVLGCLAAGFWLVEWLGLVATLDLAAVLNALAALLALAASPPSKTGVLPGQESRAIVASLLVPACPGPRAPPVPTSPSPGPCVLSSSQDDSPTRPISARSILAAAFLSGAAAMFLEIAWTRLLALVLGSSVHSFALMLACFISGIAAGSWSLGAVDPGVPAALGFARGQVLAGLLTLLALPLAQTLPGAFVAMKQAVNWSFEAFQFAQFALSALVIFPATFFFGRTVLDGLLLVPTMGMRKTLVLGACVSLAAAGVAASGVLGRKAWLRGARWCAVAVLAILAVLPDWNLAVLTQGAFRLRRASDTSHSADNPRRVLFFREDATTTVSVERFSSGVLSLKVNGKPDASNTDADMRTQLLLAHAPLVLRPDVADVLVIGLGSGTTMAAALAHPLRTADCVELSTGVREALPYFEGINRGFWKTDRRARILINDARNFLQGTPRQYDCIVSEPSNPWVAGVASLFTREFFELCRSRLRDGGLMAQWLHTYELDEHVLKTLFRTFRSVFPHAIVLRIAAADIQILGSTRPIRPDFAAAAARMRIPAVNVDLRRAGVPDLFSLAALNCFSESGLEDYSGKGLLHTDDYPVVDFLASRTFFAATSVALPDAHYRFQARDTLAALYTAGKPPTPDQLLAFARGNLDQYSKEAVLDAALTAAAARTSDPAAHRLAAEALLALGETLAALEHARAAAKLHPDTEELETLYRASLAVARLRQPFFQPPDVSEAVAAKLALVKLRPGAVEHQLGLADAYVLGGRFPEAEAEVGRILAREPKNETARALLETIRRQRAGGR
ncbi:MAG: fused MFS/spermidine synthase, partial [Candidatus Wallbacteria bacterium]|nr:fused MFS/spermidine synthase [Candidatus Wallbacteria bacterium]